MLSRYVVVKKLKNGTYALLSTISKGLIVLTAEKYDSLLCGNLEETFSKEEIDYLINKNFVVDRNISELDYLSVEMNKDRYSPKVFSTYIALSTLCNFSCVYCYENGQVDNCYKMTLETLNTTISWYKGKIIENNYKKCNVCLYGGEPLLFLDLLEKFVYEMRMMTKELSVDLSFSMITNGYLLNDRICEWLLESGLKEVQITLDGCEKVHDKRRMLKSGEGTFNVIFSNIEKICRNTNLRVVIRTSFDSSNISDVKELLEFLKKKQLEKRLLLYFAPIHQTETQKLNSCSFCSQHVYDDYYTIAEYYCDLYTTSHKLGYEIPTCYTNGPCMVLGRDSCIITPSGDIYKCVEMIGRKELCIGNVNSLKYKAPYYSFMSACNFNKCIESGCIYAPTCAGGCMMEALVKNEDINSISCHKTIFDKLDGRLMELKCTEEK